MGIQSIPPVTSINPIKPNLNQKKDLFDKWQVEFHEYENRGNGSRCFVTWLDDNGIVEFKVIQGSGYGPPKYVEYGNFKRAWVNRGFHYPFVGRIYKIKEPNRAAHPEFIFMTKLEKEINAVYFKVLPENNEYMHQRSVSSFHRFYELLQ